MPPPMVCVLRQGLIMLAQALSLECWAYIGLSVLPPDLMCFSFSFSGIHSFIHSFILADFVSQVSLNSLCSWGCFDPPALPSKDGITGLYHHALLWTRFLIMGSGILWDLGFWKSLFFLWFFKKCIQCLPAHTSIPHLCLDPLELELHVVMNCRMGGWMGTESGSSAKSHKYSSLRFLVLF